MPPMAHCAYTVVFWVASRRFNGTRLESTRLKRLTQLIPASGMKRRLL